MNFGISSFLQCIVNVTNLTETNTETVPRQYESAVRLTEFWSDLAPSLLVEGAIAIRSDPRESCFHECFKRAF